VRVFGSKEQIAPFDDRDTKSVKALPLGKSPLRVVADHRSIERKQALRRSRQGALEHLRDEDIARAPNNIAWPNINLLGNTLKVTLIADPPAKELVQCLIERSK
jgi:hypothetical protein